MHAAAPRYFYRTTLERPEIVANLCCTKPERKLPVVLNPEEVERFLAALASLKHRAILMKVYGAGLLVSEVVALRVPNVDSHPIAFQLLNNLARCETPPLKFAAYTRTPEKAGTTRRFERPASSPMRAFQQKKH